MYPLQGGIPKGKSSHAYINVEKHILQENKLYKMDNRKG